MAKTAGGAGNGETGWRDHDVMDGQAKMAYHHGRRPAMPSLSNFHLPLPPDLHELLHAEAKRSGQPATALAREALQSWLAQRRKERLHEEIAAWAAEHAGGGLDLDRDLERAGLEALEAEPSS
jgi:predicted transcriptional regulator